MSIYSGFATRNQEHYYDQILLNIMSTLLTRLLKFYRQETFDEKHFIVMMNKQIKYIQKMELRKSFQYLEPKYGQILQYYTSCFAEEVKLSEKRKKQQIKKQKQSDFYQQSRVIYEEPQKQHKIQKQERITKPRQSKINSKENITQKQASRISHHINQNIFQSKDKEASHYDRTFSALGKEFLSIKKGIDHHMSVFQNQKSESQIPNRQNSKSQNNSLSKIVQKVPKGINKRKNRLDNINFHRKITTQIKQSKNQQGESENFRKHNRTHIPQDNKQIFSRKQSFGESQDHSSFDRQSRSHTMVLVSQLGSLPSIHQTVVTKSKFNSMKKNKVAKPTASSMKLKQKQLGNEGRNQQIQGKYKSVQNNPFSKEKQRISNLNEQDSAIREEYLFQSRNRKLQQNDIQQSESSNNFRNRKFQQSQYEKYEERYQNYSSDQEQHTNANDQQIDKQQIIRQSPKKLILKKPLHYRSKMFHR